VKRLDRNVFLHELASDDNDDVGMKELMLCLPSCLSLASLPL